MAINRPTTYSSDMFIPEVIGDEIQAKLTDLIKFSPYATVDTTLAGIAGNKVTLPVYSYIGDAEDVAEGEPIPYSKLQSSATDVTIKKAGKGVDITDEALLSAFGDPIGEATSQLALSIAAKIDNDVIATLNTIGAGMTVTKSDNVINANGIADALVKFGEEVDGVNIMFISPRQLSSIRKDSNWIPASELAAELKVAGAVGGVFGTQFVISNKIVDSGTDVTNFIIRDGALKIYLKRDITVETARDIDCKTTKLTADKHYVTSLADASKAIKVVFASEDAEIPSY